MTTDERTTHDACPPGPAGLRSRAPAPDLARGFMLLLIVLANTTVYLYALPHSGAGYQPLVGTSVDRIVQALLITTVDMRVYPMFALLFGYGMWMIFRRQRAAGLSERDASRLLRRRSLWMIVFGAVHALLLWTGDILGAYGLCGLLITWLFLRRSNRTLVVWSVLGIAALTVFAVLTALGAVEVLFLGAPQPAAAGLGEAATDTVAEANPLLAAILRIAVWPVQTVVMQGVVGVVVPVAILLGIWAARRRVLEQPREHRRLLWVTAVGGIAVGWLGGGVHALAHLGVIAGLEEVLWGFSALQMLTGLFCGIGYVAVFGLIGARIQDRAEGPLRYALTAVGKRSMTCYLAQSVLCAPLLAAWGLGLGGMLGSAGAATFAVLVWLATVVLAVALEKRGDRGPAETLLRRLTYRPAS